MNPDPESSKNLSEALIDYTLPRRCFYRTFADHPGPCPSCGEPLHQTTKPYLVATRRGRRDADTFMLSSDAGWFCANCPTVVIDESRAREMLVIPMPGWDAGTEFGIMGLVDLDAIPPEQEHLPIGKIDPFPLVPFEDASSGTQPSPSRSKRKPRRTKAKRRPPKKRKRRR